MDGCELQVPNYWRIGGVLFDGKAAVIGWFGIPVTPSAAIVLGSLAKESLFYELELLAAIVDLRLWGKETTEDLHVCYGDNDSVSFFLIRASGAGDVASILMSNHLAWELEKSCVTWFARVPTGANVADHPSRLKQLTILSDDLSCIRDASVVLEGLLQSMVKPHYQQGEK